MQYLKLVKDMNELLANVGTCVHPINESKGNKVRLQNELTMSILCHEVCSDSHIAVTVWVTP